jgi:D-alanyl-D-alanine carboxypeptidase
MDVTSPEVNYELVEEFGETKEGKWLAENAHKYGFIIRYPKDKVDITGYKYEPWHLRYVGVDHAKEIHNRGISLEEYLQKP